MNTTTEKEKPARQTTKSFTVEIDTPRNQDVVLQSVPGARLRGAISASKPVIVNLQDPENKPIPTDQARHLGMIPNIPGMRITVLCSDNKYKIWDPLYDNPSTCERIKAALITAGRPIRKYSKLEGVKPVEGQLDEHRMKTLVRELRWIVEANEGKVVDGNLPGEEENDRMKGRYLLNPGSRVTNTQPLFEDQYDEWVSKLNQNG